MKKSLASSMLVALCAALVALTGCAGSSASSAQPTQVEVDSRFSENLSLSNPLDAVLVNDDNCTIAATEVFETPSVMAYELQVTNKRDAKVALRSIDGSFTANGESADATLYAELPAESSDTVLLRLVKTDALDSLDQLTDVHVQLELLDLSTVEQVALYDLTL